MTSLYDSRINDKDKRKAAKMGYLKPIEEVAQIAEEIIIEETTEDKPKKKKSKKGAE